MYDRVSEDDLEVLKDNVIDSTEEENYVVHYLPKDHVTEYFDYGKPDREIAVLLARELAKELWELDPEEASHQGLQALCEDRHGHWKVVHFFEPEKDLT